MLVLLPCAIAASLSVLTGAATNGVFSDGILR